ncbi:excalibur calcium-binding domain-containing protein [Streptomyces nogalater]
MRLSPSFVHHETITSFTCGAPQLRWSARATARGTRHRPRGHHDQPVHPAVHPTESSLGPQALRAPRPRPRPLRRRGHRRRGRGPRVRHRADRRPAPPDRDRDGDSHGHGHPHRGPRARSHRDRDPYRQGHHDRHGTVGVRRRHVRRRSRRRRRVRQRLLRQLFGGPRAGDTPVRGRPGLRLHLDRDGDGVACE